MLSNSSFDPFRRFRLRSSPVPTLHSSCEEDTDDSSPERDRPHIVHVLPPNSARKSSEPLVNIPESRRSFGRMPKKMTEGAHKALPLGDAPHASHPDRLPAKPSRSGIASDSVDLLQPSVKPSLIRRVTSKLHISIPSKSTMQGMRSRPSTRTLPTRVSPHAKGLHSPRAPLAFSPTLPNGFVSKEHREAALRERGLRPLRKDLSEQEREADECLGTTPSPSDVNIDGLSEAERLKASWLAMNQTSGCDPDGGLPAFPRQNGASTISWSILASRPTSTPDTDLSRRSDEGKADLLPAGRPSICSSVPPLTPPSYLEVLHEDPSEQAPVTPPPPISPPDLPIIISSPVESPPSPIFMESPVSCTFSSHYPWSTVESQSQSDHSRLPAKGDRRRSLASDSGDRRRKIVGSSISGIGSRSLTNLRRSVVGSLRLPSSSTLSSADLPPSSMTQVPRAAISPTIHSLGSIIREAKGITDAESRRLSELAFLD